MSFDAYVTPLEVLSAFVVLDILTGTIGAVVTKTLSSSKMREGLGHKISFYLAFALAVTCELSMQVMDVGLTVPAVAPVVVYIVGTEVVSICENLCIINPELKNNRFLNLFIKNND